MTGMLRALCVLLCLGAALPAAAGPSGPARVIDGDTVEVAGERIRLLGIDAPELRQTCLTALGRTFRCGDAARRHLAALVADRPLACTGDAQDGYGRRLARCTAGGEDIAARMVRDGMAVTFAKLSTDYAAEEAMARKAGRGLWAGRFAMPWDVRASLWTDSAAAAPDPRCPIKGNIARSGERIYHMPWGRDYLRTRIDAAKGERWFCDEAEAVRSGWRPAG